jgi:hypothetical protein
MKKKQGDNRSDTQPTTACSKIFQIAPRFTRIFEKKYSFRFISIILLSVFGLLLNVNAAVSPSIQTNGAQSLNLISVTSDASGALAHTLDQGLFCYVDATSGEIRQITEIPRTGYFSSLSPDGRYVCYKHFQQNGTKWLSFPTLYDLSSDTVIPLAVASDRSGNPVMSKGGMVAFTTENLLILLDSKRQKIFEIDLGFFGHA